MTENAPDPKTLDLVSVLEGRTYPQEKVVIFLDEDAMYRYAKAEDAHLKDPANKTLEKARDDIFEEFKYSAMIVTLRGVARPVLKALGASINKKYPVKYDAFGRPVHNAERDEAFALRLWETFITQIEHQGSILSSPSPQELKNLRDFAPDAGVDALEKAMDDLRGITKSGYEQAVQELGFLSQR